MKRILTLLLAAVMCGSLCSCSNKTEKAFEASKAAYDNVDAAYEIVEVFGSDVYEAWRVGIYDDDEIIDGGAKYLASELNLSEDEVKDGVAYAISVNIYGNDWDSVSDEDIETYREMADGFIFELMEDNLFSFCVWSVTGAYIANGQIDEAQAFLDEAKSQMKDLSENYSDYEHYPNLKGYYTTTSSFFSFCQNPNGSFEQVKTTINDYKNEARDYVSDLDYIFEE